MRTEGRLVARQSNASHVIILHFWNAVYSCIYLPVFSGAGAHFFLFRIWLWPWLCASVWCLSSHAPVAYHIILTLHLRPNLLYLFDFVLARVFSFRS